MTTTTEAPIGYPAEASDKGLKAGALGLISSIVVGIASTAPAYSLAASLGFVVATQNGDGIVGVKAPSIMLLAFVPTDGQPILIHAMPDARILLFTLLLTFATGIIFGLLPALRASRPDPWTTLKDTLGSIAGSGGSLFLRKGLVAAQVALSFLLLFGAGLFVRSLQNLKTADTGVALDNLITFQL